MSETMENVTEKAEETKAEKFVRLGEYRMNKAIDAIGRIENLANRSAYDYTPEQVGAMFLVLESNVAEVKAKFTATKALSVIGNATTDMCKPILMEIGKTVAAYDRQIARQKASNKAKEKVSGYRPTILKKIPKKCLQIHQSHATML